MGLRPSTLGQESPSEASRRDTVPKIVLPSVSLDHTLRTREDCPDIPEVLC